MDLHSLFHLPTIEGGGIPYQTQGGHPSENELQNRLNRKII